MSAIDLIKTGVGYPALFNDKVIIPSLMALGIPLEDARNYGMEGCLRWTIPGKSIVYRSTTGPVILPKCLELALNQGVDKFSGEQIGVRTPDPLTFTSLEDIMESFLTQVEHFVEKMVIFNNTTDYLYQQYIPRPFLSALLDGCLEKGKDCRQWSYYLKSPIGLIGPIDVANALAAIKKLIFEEGRVTMQELLEALKKNWEEKEELRQICLRAPKYGNDDDHVDHLAREIQYRVTEIIKKYKNLLGFPYMAEGSVASMYYGYSILTGATPDGRKDREPFADGTVSPQPGTDQKGPTAVIKSCSKIDPLKTYNQLLNQKFLPGFLEGENKEIFANYLRTWADLGNYHIQFNVVNRETLLDAQKNPEKYASLIVRVAGYSAYFVDLDEGMQNEIIRRTEQHF
jgi:formate C-acetyltransferase